MVHRKPNWDPITGFDHHSQMAPRRRSEPCEGIARWDLGPKASAQSCCPHQTPCGAREDLSHLSHPRGEAREVSSIWEGDSRHMSSDVSEKEPAGLKHRGNCANYNCPIDDPWKACSLTSTQKWFGQQPRAAFPNVHQQMLLCSHGRLREPS